MKDRIQKIMEVMQLRPTAFAQLTDIKLTTLSQILKGRNNPSLEIITKIHNSIPKINLEWLLTGKEEMFILHPDPDTEQFLLESKNDENCINLEESTDESKFGKDFAPENNENEREPIVSETIRYIEKPHKKIREIKIFYDDETYETFIPQK